MIGFIRHLVRGTPPRIHAPPDKGLNVKPGKAGLSPVSWFTAKPDNHSPRCMILDSDGLRTIVEDDYAFEGEANGWLIYDGTYEDAYSEKFLVYRLI